jgi:hypothetical protein
MNIVIANQFKNESRRIPEWLEYYRDRGITEFVLVDDNSTDNSLEAINSVKGVNVSVLKSDSTNLPFQNSLDTERYKGDVSLADSISRNFRKIHKYVLGKYGTNTILGFFDVDEYIVGETSDLNKIIRETVSQYLMVSLCSFEIDSDTINIDSNTPLIKQSTRSTSTFGRTKCTRWGTVKSFANLSREDSNIIFSTPIEDYGESVHACGIPLKMRGGKLTQFINQPKSDTDEEVTDGRLLLAQPKHLKFLHYRIPSYDLQINKPLFDTNHRVP